jgi:murein DD-endopeptidase MepM/ murein hydrolase activator NlpD
MKLKLTEQQARGLIKNLTEQEFDTTNLSKLAQALAEPKPVDTTTEPSEPTSNTPEFSPEIPEGQEMMHPLGHKTPISSQFGLRNIGVQGASRDHKGIDIPTRSGSPVYAPLDGTVTASRDTTPNACGGFIKLDHDTVDTRYCHLSRMVVNQGDKVKRGQVIGYSGGGQNDPHPGISTGPHLHYEILSNQGIAMNPTKYQSNLA